MAGLLLFVRVHPACAADGMCGVEVQTAVEVEPSATVGEVIADLQGRGTVWGPVRLEWQGRPLKPTEPLADAGVCPQSTVFVAPARSLERLSAGGSHSVALLPEGTIVCWGDDTRGQLANVPRPPRTAVQVSAGAEHSVALLDGGAVACWGQGTSGQCTPPPFSARAVQVSAGGGHSLALLEDGGVACWGDNRAGQCDTPVLGGNAVQVCAGEWHSMALLHDGTVRCWGSNDSGQCNVPDLGHRAVQVSAGSLHNIALLESGAVVCWGRNSDGRCSAPHFSAPVEQVSGGGSHSMALLDDGTVACWGSNVSGTWLSTGGWMGEQVPGLFHTSRTQQCEVPKLRCAAVQVSAGESHSTVLLEDGTVVCWGCRDDGRCRTHPLLRQQTLLWQ
eukprot:Hpha_TRINITY_DN30395_c0_g1::TRINITY_DN30395_c0_g1_i1::g.147137::m.147137